MKTLNTFTNYLLLSSVLFLQGCWWGGANGDYSPYSTKQTLKLDTKKLLETHSYESDKSFKMRDGITHAPLMSQKGQINLNLDFVHGGGTSISAAISKNIYIHAGINSLQSQSKSEGRALFNVETINYSYGQPVDTFNSSANIKYNLTMDLSNFTLFGAVGRYKTFNNNGRFEYCAGLAYGKAENNYIYDFEKSVDYSFLETRKYFQYFLQSDLGYVTTTTEGALILKASWINFLDQEFEKSYPINDYEMERNQFVLQPAIKFGFGKTLRFYTQCGWNIPLGNDQLKWFSTNVQAGIVFRINEDRRSVNPDKN